MKRSAERERTAALFEAMAARCGATCTRDRYEIDGPREITLHLTKDGATVDIELNGTYDLDAFLGHWFFDDRRGRLFRPDFGPDTWGQAHHKATSTADHAEDLCAMIEGRFLRMDDGTAFVPED